MRLVRHPWNLLLLGTASFTCTLAYLHYTAGPAADMAMGNVLLPPTAAPEPALPALVPPAPSTAAAESDVLSDPELEKLLSAAAGDFADQRLAAIAALADAPPARAVPVLLRVAELGTVGADRHAALDSLLVQARRQRDTDGAIHGLLRDLVYDGNDEEVADHAARVLEQLDASAPS